MSEYTFQSIGTVRCDGRYKFEAPRQGVFTAARAVIDLKPEFAGEALTDLAGFERVWVIFVFHQNLEAGWKVHVAPPYTPEHRKYSIFATRYSFFYAVFSLNQHIYFIFQLVYLRLVTFCSKC